jgi:hypothetical protein
MVALNRKEVPVISALFYFTPVQKVNMSVDKREILFLSPLTRLPILAKPVQLYGR